MSIQKIMSVSPLRAHMQQLSKRENPEKPEIQRNDTELLKSDALKSRFLSGISFKGHSANITCATSGDFQHSEETEIIKGEKKIIIHSYDRAEADVYFADIDEEITPEILKNHARVLVYKKMPAAISETEIREAQKSSDLFTMIMNLQLTGKLFEAKKRMKEEELDKINGEVEKAQMILNKWKDAQTRKADEVSRLDNNISVTNDKIELAQDCHEKVQERENQVYIKNKTLNALRYFISDTGDTNDETIIGLRETALKYLKENTPQQNT